MPAAYEAVILAAGRGSRLAEHTGEVPKALLPIGPRALGDAVRTSFLRRQVELLYAAGVEKVVVVVGYLREQVAAEVASWPRAPELVVNDTPEIQTSGSLHSFQFAVRAGHGLVDGTRQTLLMDADIVYHRAVLDTLLHAPEASTILVSPSATADPEEVLVYGSRQRPLYLAKGLTSPLVGGASLLGEATGIIKLAPEDHALCRAIIDWMVGDPNAPEGSLARRGFAPARRATEHEELTQRLMHLGRIVGLTFDPALPFMEVDSADEYRELEERLYPFILQLEAEGSESPLGRGRSGTRDQRIATGTPSRMILLNPGPANTTDTVKAAMTRADICPREREFGDLLARVRDDVTRVVHQGDAYTSVLFGGSGTAAVEAAVTSAVPRGGRLLVIDNGAYGKRMAQMAAAAGIDHLVDGYGVGVPPDLSRIAELLDNAAASNHRFTQLAVVHHETSSGLLNPVEAIGALCRERRIDMIVDAMSSYAGLPIDVEQMGATYLVSSANKCIQGMAGLSFVVCRREALDRLADHRPRSLYLDIGLQHRFFEAQHQMRFTPPVQVVFALEQALAEYQDEQRYGGRFLRYRQNFAVLDGGMRGLGFRRLLPQELLSGILTAYVEPTHPRYDFDELHDRLYSRGFTIYPGKGADVATFRLANMGAVTPRDMQSFIDAMSATVDEMHIQPLYPMP